MDGYVAVSQTVADAARARQETGGGEVAVIAPGIELPTSDALERAERLRARSAQRIVAFVGRLEAERRIDVLLAAIPRVRERLPNCHFVIAGSGGAEAELKGLARELDVEGAVTWTGWVPKPDPVLASAHVYVNTLPWEGFGMAMAEAMSFGLPVIAVASGASPEMVEDGVTGILVPPGDVGALADAIVDLASDEPRAAEMGGVARDRATRKYGAAQTALETLAFYRRLLDGARR
jgi:glycosyltransferase involved in cell wall biosynthesis